MRVGPERAPQKRPMQVIDLLRHTSGFTYADEGTDELHRAYDRIGVVPARQDPRRLVGDLVRMRLVHQPGEAWEYSHGVDVLGRFVEVASGQPLDKFFESRIFKPLGMVDTGFFVPAGQARRGWSIRSPAAGRGCGTSPSPRRCSWAAAVSPRRRPTTCASARCC